MKRMMLVGGLVAAVLCGGCASAVKKVDVNKGLEAFYAQPRTVDLLTVRGTNPFGAPRQDGACSGQA